MLPYRDSRLTVVLLGIFFLVAISYALFEARGQLMGPTIIVDTRVGSVDDPLILIEGHAERISSLMMNGREIPVTEDGLFREPYLIAAGYNRILLTAKDSYGRSAERVLEIVYTPEEEVEGAGIGSSSTAPATSTPSDPSASSSATATTSSFIFETSTTTTLSP